MQEKKLWFILLLMNFYVSAQTKGVVVDESGKPIPYVNIWVENENIGTTSEENGEFSINVSDNKYLIFSAIGYVTQRKISNILDKIVLTSKTIELNEVIVKTNNSKQIEIGNFDSPRGRYTAIEGKEGYLVAKYFQYNPNYDSTQFIKNIIILTKSEVKGATFRVRILKVDQEGKPSESLIEDNIIINTKKGKRKNIIDISKYNLTFPIEGIFIAFEVLLIERNKYKNSYTLENTSQKIKENCYAPNLLAKIVAEENTYHTFKGMWIKTKRNHNGETSKRYIFFNHKVMEPAINLTLTN